jgi:hypothetical protein
MHRGGVLWCGQRGVQSATTNTTAGRIIGWYTLTDPGCWGMTTGPFRRRRQESAILETVAHPPMELIDRYALREHSKIEVQRVKKRVASCPECEDRL